MKDQLAILGGAPVRPQGYPEWPDVDEATVARLTETARSGEWGGFPFPGPNTALFAERFAALQEVRHAVPMANGTVTMEVALKALGIGWGDEVIVPALTFAATAYAPLAAGALPVIVDVSAESLAIDPDAVEAAITPQTKAIIPVHLGQVMADMDRLTEIASRHDLAIIEDCAHSHGKQWRGRGAGAIAAFGSFSHQSSKILTSGEGGTLTTNDDRLAELATSIIDCGRAKDPDEERFTFGANYRLSELQAAALVGQVDKFESQMADRAHAAAYFEELMAGAEGVRLLEIDERITRRSFYRYIVCIDPEAFAGADSDLVCDALDEEGVGCWVGYPSLTRDPLFQPWLSRLPAAVEHADRLRPEAWACPVSDRAGSTETVYLDENVFRAGRQGVEDAVTAINKIRDGASGLRSLMNGG
ncbi:MAG: DegT/DnrJ/EryC1/StrS family aminotransferase [bacterium]|nr:DegT/DnrJ/EryC1/StrS family aminotransferase [bacterium]